VFGYLTITKHSEGIIPIDHHVEYPVHQLDRQTQHLSSATEDGCNINSGSQESELKTYLILLNNFGKFVANLFTALHLSTTCYRRTRIGIGRNNVSLLSLERAAAARFYSVDLKSDFR